jgi:tRNA C32,U32 (ribose-2'-O)-methylase TrmJ
MKETPKTYAFQVFHKGRVVAEAPLIVHDLDRAIEAVEDNLAASSEVRDKITDILTLLRSTKRECGTYTGVAVVFGQKE